jgi:hypothetical protein
MASFDDLREIALILPGAYEDRRRGGPAFRVNGRKFALWWAEGGRAILKLSPPHQERLFELRPETFEPCPVGRVNWSFVDLEALDLAELRDLVVEAWATVAPRRVSRTVVADYREGGPLSSTVLPSGSAT